MKKIILLFFILGLTCLSGCKLLDNWSNQKPETQQEASETLSKKIIIINSENAFEKEILKSDKPSIVKFETEWCGACKLMIPLYSQLADKFEGKINFVKVDADDLKSIAEKYGIAGVPTFIFFKNGKVMDKVEGAIEEDEFLEKIKEIFEVE